MQVTIIVKVNNSDVEETMTLTIPENTDPQDFVDDVLEGHNRGEEARARQVPDYEYKKWSLQSYRTLEVNETGAPVDQSEAFRTS